MHKNWPSDSSYFGLLKVWALVTQGSTVYVYIYTFKIKTYIYGLITQECTLVHEGLNAVRQAGQSHLLSTLEHLHVSQSGNHMEALVYHCSWSTSLWIKKALVPTSASHHLFKLCSQDRWRGAGSSAWCASGEWQSHDHRSCYTTRGSCPCRRKDWIVFYCHKNISPYLELKEEGKRTSAIWKINQIELWYISKWLVLSFLNRSYQYKGLVQEPTSCLLGRCG